MTIKEINEKVRNAPDLLGTTGNERLVLTGLLEEFEWCRSNEPEKAKYILEQLQFDSASIDRILNN